MAEEWHRRIDANEPWVLHWLEHQTEDAYWRRASVWFDDADAIQAATLVIAGHADGYRNMAFRTFERLRGPKAILGPWSHMSPRLSIPGPRIDHVPVMIAWWKRWLGEDEDVDVGPPISIFVRRWSDPEPDLDTANGEWRAEPAWPPARLADAAVARVGGRARREAEPGVDRLAIRGDVGVTGSIWCAGVQPFGLPWDQRPDEAFSLVYDWPVEEELEIMGRPGGAPRRGVGPGGVRLRQALRRRAGRTVGARHPRDPEPHPSRFARAPRVAGPRHVRLRDDRARRDGVRVRAGTPDPPRPRAERLPVVVASAARRRAPVRPRSLDPRPPRRGRPARRPAPVFAPGAPTPDRPDRVRWDVVEDVLGRTRAVRIDHGGERGRYGIADASDRYWGEIGVRPHEPGIAWASAGASLALAWDEAEVRNEARAELRSDATTWTVAIDLEVFDGDERIAERHWERTIPRELG